MLYLLCPSLVENHVPWPLLLVWGFRRPRQKEGMRGPSQPWLMGEDAGARKGVSSQHWLQV